jgi:hypothetical protein
MSYPTMGGDVIRCLNGFPVEGLDGRCGVNYCGPCWAGMHSGPHDGASGAIGAQSEPEPSKENGP